MRQQASVLHLDLDAFFAAVEQRDKPSLRGKPVVVGGVGYRGVVATASYEARRYGVRSAMSSREARARCPHAAYLSGRFRAYRETSVAVMTLLRSVSPLVEPLSLDEAFVDLATATPPLPGLDVADVTAFAEELRGRVTEVTGGLTASVGVATSKFVAKVASDLDKPDGLVVVAPGTERDLLRPMHVTVIPGVGPATAERLRRAGIQTVADLEAVSEDELVRLVGRAHGTGLFHLARAEDDRVGRAGAGDQVGERGGHLRDRPHRPPAHGGAAHPAGHRGGGAAPQARPVGAHRHHQGAAARLHHAQPVHDAQRAHRLPRRRRPARPRRCSPTSTPPAACGCSASASPGSPTGSRTTCSARPPWRSRTWPRCPTCRRGRRSTWAPGQDVEHAELGRGWVWGSGRGVVTVRFETAETPPGPVRSFAVDDPDLAPWPAEETGGAGRAGRAP